MKSLGQWVGPAALMAVLFSRSTAEAAETLVLPLPVGLPDVKVLTILIAVHLVGLCCGLGATTMLDFWVLRWLRWGGMPPVIERTFRFLMKVATVGLVLLWVSGLGFVALYTVEAPEKLENPKLWAKVAIVLALTLNGALLHAVVLPGVLREVSRPILHGISRPRTALFLVSGAVSGVSWYIAFALGILREFNGTVPFATLIGAWATAVVLMAVAATLVWHMTRRTIAAAEPDGSAIDGAVEERSDAAPNPAVIPQGALVPLSRRPAPPVAFQDRKLAA